MRWRETVTPEPMSRVAVVAPRAALRDALVRVADEGVMEIERTTAPADLPIGEAGRHLQRLSPGTPVTPKLARTEPDLADLAAHGRADLLAGEAELDGYRAEAVPRGAVAGLVGWVPRAKLPALSARLAEVGAAVAALPVPRGLEPPSAARSGPARRAFAPLVETYATVPYADVDPTVLAGIAYVAMFGAMFGDAGHGALLLLIACAIRLGRPRRPGFRRLASLRPHWLFIAGAGISSALFGLAYGEFFGPTGLVPTLWLAPMDRPVSLLVGGVALGAVLLAGAYLLGTVNRVREGGWAVALYAPSGLAGALLFVAAGLAVAAWHWRLVWVGLAAAGLAAIAVGLAYTGLLAAAGRGAAGVLQATVELFDVLVRVGTNVVSFARLAAFGLTHAVLGWIVWQATTGLWRSGPLWVLAAVVVFVAGNALSFALEALVAGVQALRLEYYELFSRVFRLEGRPFRPWHVPLAASTEEDR
jgi:V/A-type H+/Na+-transporting ATPase subunit I